MAKIRVRLRPSLVKGKAGTVYYQLSHRKVVRHITTGIHIHPEDWNEERGSVCSNVEGHEYIQSKIDTDIASLRRIVCDLELSDKIYDTSDIIKRFKKPEVFISFFEFFEQQIRFLTECNKLGTAQNYRRAYISLKTFLNGDTLAFGSLTTGFIDSYNDFLIRKGLVRNSISFYMRILRAVYNKGVRRGLAKQTYPFREVYTGIDKTRKLAVDESVMKCLVSLDLTENSALSFARDLFLFSFYTRGMSFIDIAYLKKSDVQNGVIIYSRHKTGQSLSVKIEPCIRTIIEKYTSRETHHPYVFPILNENNSEETYNLYKNRLRAYNSHLKQLSEKMGLGISLSSYTSRHTWASMARNHNIPLSVISAGMGHTSERTTQIYLTSIENNMIDGANKTLLDTVNSLILNKKEEI